MSFRCGFRLVTTAAAAILTFPAHAAKPAVPSRELIVDGDFENHLSGWNSSGAVELETASTIDGKASVRIGPGGSISQRLAVGPENHMSVSAVLRSDKPLTGDGEPGEHGGTSSLSAH